MSLPGLADTGLTILPRQGLRSLGIAMVAGLGFGIWMALADTTIFASVVPPVQHAMLAESTAAQRIALFARGAFLDEIALRLFALTAIIWLVMALTGKQGSGHGSGVYWAAILLVAFIVYPMFSYGYFRALDWSGLVILRELTLHCSAGVLWGYLCWRHGWLAALTGHVSAHLALQPLLSI